MKFKDNYFSNLEILKSSLIKPESINNAETTKSFYAIYCVDGCIVIDGVYNPNCMFA